LPTICCLCLDSTKAEDGQQHNVSRRKFLLLVSVKIQLSIIDLRCILKYNCMAGISRIILIKEVCSHFLPVINRFLPFLSKYLSEGGKKYLSSNRIKPSLNSLPVYRSHAISSRISLCDYRIITHDGPFPYMVFRTKRFFSKKI